MNGSNGEAQFYHSDSGFHIGVRQSRTHKRAPWPSLPLFPLSRRANLYPHVVGFRREGA